MKCKISTASIQHILFVTRIFPGFFPLDFFKHTNMSSSTTFSVWICKRLEWLLFFWKVIKKQLVYDKNRIAGMGKASYLHLKIKSMLQESMGIDPEAFLNVNSYPVKILSKKGWMKPFSFFLPPDKLMNLKIKFAHINGQKITITTFLKCFVKKYKTNMLSMWASQFSRKSSECQVLPPVFTKVALHFASWFINSFPWLARLKVEGIKHLGVMQFCYTV